MAKLLIVVDDFVAGGAFKVGELLAHGLLALCHLTFACDFSPLNEDARRALQNAGVKVVRLFANAGQIRRSICDADSAKALIRRTAPDKILFVDSSPRSNVAIKDAARMRAIPFVAIVNFVDRITPVLLRSWDADVARAAEAACVNVFVSAAAQADFEANFPGVNARRCVVTNGVSDRFFKPVDRERRLALRREFAVADDETAVLLAGRLETRKGQALALDALAALSSRKDGPRTHLWLAGHGDDAEIQRLDDKIRALGLEGVARRLGKRDDLPELMDACDIVLMPSKQEADPLVSKEAMAKGRPVIASDLGGVREQGHHESQLFPVEDASSSHALEALVAVLEDLRRDADKRARIGAALRDTAIRRFTVAQMIDAYAQLLADLPSPANEAPPECDIQPVETGCWMPLAHSRQALRIFKDGWSDIEEGALWLLGGSARLAFVMREPASRLTIDLDCGALARRGRAATFEVWTRGRKIADLSFAGSRRTTVTLRFDAAPSKRSFVLLLRNTRPTSPKALGLSEDARPLGLRVFALRINTRLRPSVRLVEGLHRLLTLRRTRHSSGGIERL